MKSTLAILLGAGLASQAALIPFDLSPGGTDAALGLSPTNEVPAVTNSFGFGNEVDAGILFDTETFELHIAIGYGSAAGFADLTGPASAMHIHGPAPTGSNATVIVDLQPYHVVAADPAKGGLITGVIAFPTNAVADLLAGLTYINIHTATNPGGEIRGQLIPVVITNSPPEVTCNPEVEVECDEPAQLTGTFSDPDGDELTVVWSVNGTAMQTNTVAATDPPAPADVNFTVSLPLGTNEVTVTATDTAGNSASCSSVVVVADTEAPEIKVVKADRNVLWPPNHRLVTVYLSATVSDECGDATWKVTSVRSSEPDNGKGDGNTTGDCRIVGNHTVKLRAERSGTGPGRIYYVTVQATDAAGNESETRTINVVVPKSQGKSIQKITVAETKAKVAAAKANANAKVQNGKALGKKK
ncbi:MAG TPA: CHRD domain-containing protein [Clostridia bacterium]|nr:CHRD domain-containing protein [Clostridia bacterium]